jgi:hypothetical protein
MTPISGRRANPFVDETERVLPVLPTSELLGHSRYFITPSAIISAIMTDFAIKRIRWQGGKCSGRAWRQPLNRRGRPMPEDFREASHEPGAAPSFFFAARFRLRVAAAFRAVSLRCSGVLLTWPFKTACRKRSLPMV